MNRQKLKTKTFAVAGGLLQAKGYISTVDVLLAMGKLTKEDHERWRFKQVPHLEKVVLGSLNQLQFLLRTLRSHARDDLRLKASRTVYTSWGKGRRQPLRFTKYGHPFLEELYSTHYVKPEAGGAQVVKAALPLEAAVSHSESV